MWMAQWELCLWPDELVKLFAVHVVGGCLPDFFFNYYFLICLQAFLFCILLTL